MPAQHALKPRREPSQERSRDTVDAILDAAARVFERHGYAAGTTNRIAERAGVSVGSLYQYFPNKDAILVALTRRHLAEGRAIIGPLFDELTSAPPPLGDGLRRLAQAMIDLHRDEPGLHRVLFEETPRPPALARELAEVERLVIGAIAAWLRAYPEVTAPDLELAARYVAAVVESAAHRLVIHPLAGDVDPDRHAAEAAFLLAAYLTAERPA
jgi:AcrR family transcriptional regulator